MGINQYHYYSGISVGATANAEQFLTLQTIRDVLGVIAFGVGSASGVILAKILNKFSKDQLIHWLVQQVSAVPMAARVSEQSRTGIKSSKFPIDACYGT